MDFIVLSTSRGTTFQAVIDAVQSGTLTARCLGLVSDRADRGCIAKAEAAGLPVRIVERKKDALEEFEADLDAAVRSLAKDPEKTVLAAMGWMWILGPRFVNAWRGRMLNVHPALLPKHGGKGMYGDHVHAAVLAAGETESGITIHTVDSGVDTGPILLQKSFPVGPDDTVESLRDKAQTLEREWYPKTLQMIETGELSLNL
jgi:phosphoribosylglycinamide formyltransferase-1